MQYISTRGKAQKMGFKQVALTGIASDGGLYVPEFFPEFDASQISKMVGMSYEELFFKICKPFVGGEISDADFKKIINKSYQNFNHQAIAPLSQIGNNEFILELYHGPTLAFKDFALQFLGNLFDFLLAESGEKVTIIGATSGDTGSAAIEGCKGAGNLDIFILHPYQRVSEVQRRQMTSVIADNVYNIAYKGSFDDCQDIVKQLFRQQELFAGKTKFVAVNSINWARIMAQIVYYFYSALHLGAPAKSVSFSVPTGNFGDIFAGYIAKKMGLPIDRLVIATNHNDILHRLMETGKYSRSELVPTLSPSMDIQISSNFERMLFEVYQRSGGAIDSIMSNFRQNPVTIEARYIDYLRKIYDSCAVDDETTCQVIADVFKTTGKIVDPHTAIGIKAGRECSNKQAPMVCLATAHAAKFADAITKAGVPEPSLPEHLSDLLQREERYEIIDTGFDNVKDYITRT